MESNQYKCAACGNTYEKGWSDDEANAEFLKTFPSHIKKERATICENCYEKLKKILQLPQ